MHYLISIIIPTYNRAHIILDTLESIKQQTFKNWECIIVDDNSTDNTESLLDKWIKQDQRFKYLKRPQHMIKGPNACRNYGYTKSRGEFIYFFDSDDILVTNALEMYFNLFSSDTDAVIAPLEKTDLNSGKVYSKNTIKSKKLIEDYFSGEVAFYVCGPLWRRSFLDKQEYLFDEKIRNLDDWDFNLRMLYQNPKLKYTDTPLIKYRHHPSSLKNELGKANTIETLSAITAKERHIAILSNNKGINIVNIKKSYISYLKQLLQSSALKRKKISFYILKKLILQSLSLRSYLSIFKVVFGFIITYIFKRGARLI